MNDEQRAARVEAAWLGAPTRRTVVSRALEAADAAVPVVAVEDVRRWAIRDLPGLAVKCLLCAERGGKERHDPHCPLAGTEPK